MSVTVTAGIAAAWSAAKTSANDQTAQLAGAASAKATQASDEGAPSR